LVNGWGEGIEECVIRVDERWDEEKEWQLEMLFCFGVVV
jgi:hypothetical protein